MHHQSPNFYAKSLSQLMYQSPVLRISAESPCLLRAKISLEACKNPVCSQAGTKCWSREGAGEERGHWRVERCWEQGCCAGKAGWYGGKGCSRQQAGQDELQRRRRRAGGKARAVDPEAEPHVGGTVPSRYWEPVTQPGCSAGVVFTALSGCCSACSEGCD